MRRTDLSKHRQAKRNRLAGIALAAGCGWAASAAASADTFTWTPLSGGDASGSWNAATNWNDGAGPIASGADHLATFTTLDITTDSIVTLDGDQTIGSMTFGDSATATAASWTVNTGTGGTLTLATTSGSPTITVNSTVSGGAVINATLAGNNGLSKAGAGTLSLTGTNSFTGGIRISAGTLSAGSAAAINGNAITMSGGTMNFGATGTWGNNLELTASAAINGPAGTGSNINLGTLRLGSQLTVNSLSGVNNPRFVFGDTTLTGNATINIRSDGSSLSQSGPNVELTNVTVDATSVADNTTTTLSFTRQATVNRTRYFLISGIISDASASKRVGIRLANSNNSKPNVLLTGENTYTGLTQVSGGTLYLDGGSLATSNVLIDGGTVTGGNASGGSNGTIHFHVDGNNATAIRISGAGVLNLSKLVLDVNVTNPTQLEYVIVDKAVGSANIVGEAFANVTGLQTNWTIDYDGTAAHPGAIVLSVPEPGGLVAIGVGLTGLLARRRRTKAD